MSLGTAAEPGTSRRRSHVEAYDCRQLTTVTFLHSPRTTVAWYRCCCTKRLILGKTFFIVRTVISLAKKLLAVFPKKATTFTWLTVISKFRTVGTDGFALLGNWWWIWGCSTSAFFSCNHPCGGCFKCHLVSLHFSLVKLHNSLAMRTRMGRPVPM